MTGAVTRASLSRRRWGLALVLVACLNLWLQPCMALAPAPAPAAEHCDHGGESPRTFPCPALQGGSCDMNADVNAEGLSPVVTSRPDGSFERPTADSRVGAATGLAVLHGARPLHLLYCHLRN